MLLLAMSISGEICRKAPMVAASGDGGSQGQAWEKESLPLNPFEFYTVYMYYLFLKKNLLRKKETETETEARG